MESIWVYGCLVAMTLGLSAFEVAASAPEPPLNGLAVWLDASAQDTLTVDESGSVTAWASRKPGRLGAAVPTEAVPPEWVADAMGPGRPALRLRGQSWLELPKVSDAPGSLTLFVVFQRPDDQGGGSRWQRVVSSYDGVSENDTKGAGVFLDTRGTAEPMPPKLFVGSFPRAQRGPITLGRNQRSHTEYLQGDIAEILIYDRGFLVDEQYAKVEDYLKAKWGIVDDPRDDWTRARPLGDTPARLSDELPLSDQANAGAWKKYPPMTDEFEGPTLSARKWHDHNPRWYGRVPALFLPSNVRVEGGEMHLIMRHDPSLPEVTKYRDSVYRDFSSASVVSREPVLYGYFEIEARAMASAGSSAWWFASSMQDQRGRTSRTEIDVFELGGGAEGHENLYHMNAHIFETPEDGPKKWNKGGTWSAPFNFAEGYHVFGLEWTPEHLHYFVDGVLVRRLPNTHWHTPIYMIFDSETMTDWLGWPDPSDLPSTFSVRYVRAWKNQQTMGRDTGRWQEPGEGDTEITRFVREYEQERARQRPAK